MICDIIEKNTCDKYDKSLEWIKSNEFRIFNPKLNEKYARRFTIIVYKITNELRGRRVQYIEEQIKKLKNDIGREEYQEEDLKFLSTLYILKDLLEQEWRITVFKNETYLAPPKQGNTNKIYLRQQLQYERNLQLKKKSIKKFIRKMERIRKHKGKDISIRNLIGDKHLLISRIEEIKKQSDDKVKYELAKKSIKPYIQRVDDSKCEHTGYKLKDIWRYFRYTWSLPYKSTPGRNLFYLIRDASQPYHPIIGIFALGNTVLHLKKRDNYIGWTLDAIKTNLKRKKKVINYTEKLKGEINEERKVNKFVYLETQHEHLERIKRESNELIKLLNKFIDNALQEISTEGLVSKKEIQQPNKEIICRLNEEAAKLRNKQLNNKRKSGDIDFRKESNIPLFKKKRAQELAKLLEAKMIISKEREREKDPVKVLRNLINYRNGKIVNIALQANRKQKIGSNMMEIIVCGAIPPYNEILGGKLVSLLTCSPTVIKEYNEKYSNQVSEIASRMKGEKVIKDSRLVYLGTTSLYGMGSSQYNRIKMPINEQSNLEFKELGKTEGYSSVFFSEETSYYIGKMLEKIDGGRRVNNVFGEGTSPRMRLLKMGFSALGLSEHFIKQHTQRIIYGIELASNSLEFLKGKTNKVDYLYSLDGNEDSYTQEIIDFWLKRWFLKRIYTVDIYKRLNRFEKDLIIVSNNL